MMVYMSVQAKKKLTKKQEAAKRKAQEKKQLQKQSHPMNTEPPKLDLLSKTGTRKLILRARCPLKFSPNEQAKKCVK